MEQFGAHFPHHRRHARLTRELGLCTVSSVDTGVCVDERDDSGELLMMHVRVSRCPLHDAVRLSRSERQVSRRLLSAAAGKATPCWWRSVLSSMVMCQPVVGAGLAATLLRHDD